MTWWRSKLTVDVGTTTAPPPASRAEVESDVLLAQIGKFVGRLDRLLDQIDPQPPRRGDDDVR